MLLGFDQRSVASLADLQVAGYERPTGGFIGADRSLRPESCLAPEANRSIEL